MTDLSSAICSCVEPNVIRTERRVPLSACPTVKLETTTNVTKKLAVGVALCGYPQERRDLA
ncbi:hypothetical protein FYZ48_16940 [Gimesia chilikensis]|uniref:hypothetical protein n=1 Tax=Gimesia chilikensis TaxID=2605989 RepID=UPI0011EFF765|nr:hypothetical protein [Gimesia chilikensis]KAA0135819.1 hypothetical protein FYZ48_16940 [Gimesia chilikensis]